jgi:hypothetical protein
MRHGGGAQELRPRGAGAGPCGRCVGAGPYGRAMHVGAGDMHICRNGCQWEWEPCGREPMWEWEPCGGRAHVGVGAMWECSACGSGRCTIAQGAMESRKRSWTGPAHGAAWRPDACVLRYHGAPTHASSDTMAPPRMHPHSTAAKFTGRWATTHTSVRAHLYGDCSADLVHVEGGVDDVERPGEPLGAGSGAQAGARFDPGLAWRDFLRPGERADASAGWERGAGQFEGSAAGHVPTTGVVGLNPTSRPSVCALPRVAVCKPVRATAIRQRRNRLPPQPLPGQPWASQTLNPTNPKP